jgi:hypothetical protein
MFKRVIAIAIGAMAFAPAFAEGTPPDPAQLKNCPPIGQSAKGELMYSLDCAAIKTDYPTGSYKPDMPRTKMKETVIPKSGAVQTPETTPTQGDLK